MIDLGFVVSAFVPLVFLWILGEDNLRANWRISLGLGIIPPFALFFLRFRLHEPEQTKKNSMAHVKTPYWLIIKFYWFRLLVVSLIWFIYDVRAHTHSLSLTVLVQGADARDSSRCTLPASTAPPS